MLEQLVWNNPLPVAADGPWRDRDRRCSVHDGADDQIEAGCPKSLAVKRAIMVSPRSWKNTARLSICAASPL